MGRYPHNCGQCRDDSRLRQEWGCDTETSSELDRIPCCSGGCSACEGRGYRALRRCPSQILPPNIQLTIRYSALAKEGMWPAAGGALDQSQSFLDAHAVILGEIAEIERQTHGSE